MRGKIRRGEIYIANLDPALGSEEGKERRVLIVSNDIGNGNIKSPVIIAVPITSEITDKRKRMPMYVPIYPNRNNGQTVPALIDCGQIRVLDIDKRLKELKGYASESIMRRVDAALETCLQLRTCPRCSIVLLPNKNHCVSCKLILVHICTNCHNKISNTYKYCPHCAKEQEEYR